MRYLSFAAAVATAVAQTVDVTTVTYDTRACRPGWDHFTFCNTSLTTAQRVEALLAEVKDDEIVPFLTARSTQIHKTNNITRLGIPHYDWGLNCIHGVQSSCVKDASGKVTCPTSFPNPVNYGAAFNRSGWLKMGEVLGVETRAMWLAGAVEPGPRIRVGLDCWSPNININHDPRWGRNQEVPSEDPLINGLYGALYTYGMQHSNKDPALQAITTLKHWDAYTLENSDGFTRHTFNAVLDNATFADTFFPAWKQAVTIGKAKGVMCSYNSVNGVPTCANPFLKDVLRNTFEFDGYMTSDSGAITDIFEYHHYVRSPAEAACLAVKDGSCDVDSGDVYYDALMDGVKQGLCDLSEVKLAWKHAMSLLFEMGLFDPAEKHALWNVPITDVATEESLAESRHAALESLVLLKNANSTLPLPKGKKYAVIGPHAKAQEALVGNYIGQICPDNHFDCVEAMDAALHRIGGGDVYVEEGCSIKGTSTSGFDAALALVDKVDYVVLAIGTDGSVEGEAHDRTAINLPGVQADLVAKVLAAAGRQRKPVTLVLVNGGMVALGKDVISQASAIVEAFFPGYFGANAVAATLFGDNKYLGGKMPYTVYPASYTQSLPITTMSMNKPGTPGRSYKYYTGETEFDFGFGLSFTSFSLQAEVSGSHPTCASYEVTGHVRVTVKNTGAAEGDTVVQFYAVGGRTGSGLPVVKKLVGFERVHLKAGDSTDVNFQLTSDDFLDIADNGDHVCSPGVRTLRVTDGVVSQDIPLTIGGSPATAFKFPDVPPRTPKSA